MIKNILTIDLEDWFQSSLELFGKYISNSKELSLPTKRVVENTYKLLELLSLYNTKATFFVLGNVAELFPFLVKEIYNQGHEIASHGYSHKLVYKQTREEFREDLRKSIKIIEDITGEKILGYRAPYFSIREDSMWAIEILKEEGLKYDASIFPLKRKLYGVSETKIDTNGVVEFPVSKISFLGYEFPFGGGGYLRLFPYALTKWAIRKLNKQRVNAIVYVHPYEIDIDDFQNYMLPNNIKIWFIRFTQEYNRKKTLNKLLMLLRDFMFVPIKDLLYLDYTERC